tara:strand:- start:1849 stop:4302 length:2454 start_codon:yes stop_codon:yes gene_type:complete
MATKKYLTKYARGSKAIPKLDDGLRAMQIQSQTQTQALEKRKQEQKLFDASYGTGLDRAAKAAEANRKLVRQIEVETPEKLRADALKRNNITQQNNFKVKIKEQQELAKMWGKLSPTLAANVQKAIGNAIDYFQTEAGIAEYESELADGTVGSINQVYQKAKSKVDFLDFSQQRFNAIQEYLKTGNIDDKQTFDYLTNVNETRNPVTREIFYLNHVKNFDGFERDFLKFAEQQGIPVDKKSVVGLYQFRAQELMKQNGINPKSELGLKLQNLYRQKGFTAENQFTLGDDYEKQTQVINGFSERIKAISNEKFTRADFSSDAEYENVKKAFYNRKNALFVDTIASVNARPIQKRDGTYSKPIVPNTRANIVGWAKSEMDNYNDFQTYLEHVMGVTPESPDGYLIPGADKDTPKNHILAKFPYLKQELADDFAERFRKKTKDQETLNKARLQNDALKYQQRMNDGYYKENPDAFFADWEASNGNQYARELFAGSLGFKSQYINAETLSSTIVQAYKNGDMRLVYHAWAALPDEQQKIGFIYDDLNALAQAQGVQFEDLDDHIKKITDATIDEVEKDGVLDKAAGPSASTMADYMRSELLSRYAADRNGTPEERYSRAKESIDKQLGYVNGVLVNFDKDGFRGSGLFRQKQGKSGATNRIIFTRFAGENFGNISSFEIDATLGDTKGQSRVNGLVDLVAADMGSNSPTINNTHLYNLLKTGKTNNALLNKLMDESVLQGVQKEDFVNTLKNTVDADARTKKAVMQWGADKWCDQILGPRAAGMSNDQKALQVCVNAIEAQFDMPAWEFLLNAKNRERLQN